MTASRRLDSASRLGPVEVDVILEKRQPQVVGIEVEAASPVGQDDVNGLRHLAQRLGDDFTVGLVMYTGQQSLSFGPRVRAMLVSAICEVPMPDDVPVTCPIGRRTGRFTVAHGQAGTPPDLHPRCPARLHSEPSKLVMRVRFPSSALVNSCWSAVPVDARGVDLQQDRDAVPGSLGEWSQRPACDCRFSLTCQ
jgi:hypothetical protein